MAVIVLNKGEHDVALIPTLIGSKDIVPHRVINMYKDGVFGLKFRPGSRHLTNFSLNSGEKIIAISEVSPTNFVYIAISQGQMVLNSVKIRVYDLSGSFVRDINTGRTQVHAEIKFLNVGSEGRFALASNAGMGSTLVFGCDRLFSIKNDHTIHNINVNSGSVTGGVPVEERVPGSPVDGCFIQGRFFMICGDIYTATPPGSSIYRLVISQLGVYDNFALTAQDLGALSPIDLGLDQAGGEKFLALVAHIDRIIVTTNQNVRVFYSSKEDDNKFQSGSISSYIASQASCYPSRPVVMDGSIVYATNLGMRMLSFETLINATTTISIPDMPIITLNKVDIQKIRFDYKRNLIYGFDHDKTVKAFDFAYQGQSRYLTCTTYLEHDLIQCLDVVPSIGWLLLYIESTNQYVLAAEDDTAESDDLVDLPWRARKLSVSGANAVFDIRTADSIESISVNSIIGFWLHHGNNWYYLVRIENSTYSPAVPTLDLNSIAEYTDAIVITYDFDYQGYTYPKYSMFTRISLIDNTTGEPVKETLLSVFDRTGPNPYYLNMLDVNHVYSGSIILSFAAVSAPGVISFYGTSAYKGSLTLISSFVFITSLPVSKHYIVKVNNQAIDVLGIDDGVPSSYDYSSYTFQNTTSVNKNYIEVTFNALTKDTTNCYVKQAISFS